MPTTFTKIAAVTVGSGGAANIEFTSIPSTYTDLVIKLSARTNRSAIEEAIDIQFNSSGGTAYSSRRLYGTGSVAASDSGSSQAFTEFYSVNGGTSTGSTFGNAEIYIPNYAGSNNKSLSTDAVTENNATAVTTGLQAGLWANSAAITSIKLTPASAGSLQQYSTATLYGIKNS
jgi:hypothetical protein